MCLSLCSSKITISSSNPHPGVRMLRIERQNLMMGLFWIAYYHAEHTITSLSVQFHKYCVLVRSCDIGLKEARQVLFLELVCLETCYIGWLWKLPKELDFFGIQLHSFWVTKYPSNFTSVLTCIFLSEMAIPISLNLSNIFACICRADRNCQAD